jgi:hypothetical protein
MFGDPIIDWALLVRNAVEFNATAPFLYSLTFFHRLGASGLPVPDELRRIKSTASATGAGSWTAS